MATLTTTLGSQNKNNPFPLPGSTSSGSNTSATTPAFTPQQTAAPAPTTDFSGFKIGSNGYAQPQAPAASPTPSASTASAPITAPTQTTAPPTPSAPAQTQPVASPSPSTYGGILAGTAVDNPYQQNIGSSISGLLGTASNLGTTGQAATTYQDAAAKYAKDIADYKQNLAAIQNQAGIPKEFATGRAAQYQATTGGLLQGEAEGLSAYQQAVNNAIAGQHAQQAGFTQGAAAAQGGQGLVQSALTTAGQLAQPGVNTQQVGQGTTVLNAAGQPVATTPVIAPVGTQYPYSVSPTTYGPGGEPTTYASGSQQGGGAENTPFTGGQAQASAQIGAQVKQNEATIGAAQFIQQKINNEITQHNINPSALTAVNFWNQWIHGQVSDPNYQNFAADMTDYAATIAPLLGYGGNITDLKTGIAEQMVPMLSQGQTVMQALDNLNKLALGKNQAFGTAGLSGTNPSGSPTSSSGQTTVPGMSGSYYQDSSGVWHPSQ